MLKKTQHQSTAEEDKLHKSARRTAGSLLLLLALTGTGCRRSAAVRNAAAQAQLTGDRTLHVEPDAGFAWLYTLVNNAHSTIDMTMYELADPTFSADLVTACARGVRVRVILDQSLEKAANTPVYTQLNSAGPNCSAAWSNPQFAATHEKSLVIDDATAVIMSLNLTARYYSATRDFAVVEDDATDIRAIDTAFTTDLNSTTDVGYHPRGGDDLIWSPTAAQLALLNIIQSAKQTLLVENEELSSTAIVEALERDCSRGVDVRIAMTDTSPAYHANYKALQTAGCGVHTGPNNPTALYIHAKAMVADLGTAGQVGYLGSINFSDTSMNRNRELGLYLYDPTLLNQLNTILTRDYAAFPAFL